MIRNRPGAEMEVDEMIRTISYDPLWKKLIDHKLTKTELAEKAGVSRNTIVKMGKNEYVALEIVVRICNYLDCELWDVMELVSIDHSSPDQQ